MPLVRVDLSSNALPKLRQTVSDVVYDAMITVAKVPADDKFQIVTGHAADELVFPKEGYLGIDYTDGIIFIQVTWNAGRSTEVKKAFYRKIADDLHSKAGVRKQDVFINLVDVLPENWSFGNGKRRLPPKRLRKPWCKGALNPYASRSRSKKPCSRARLRTRPGGRSRASMPFRRKIGRSIRTSNTSWPGAWAPRPSR